MPLLIKCMKNWEIVAESSNINCGKRGLAPFSDGFSEPKLPDFDSGEYYIEFTTAENSTGKTTREKTGTIF
jgi:hypothetical protein